MNRDRKRKSLKLTDFNRSISILDSKCGGFKCFGSFFSICVFCAINCNFEYRKFSLRIDGEFSQSFTVSMKIIKCCTQFCFFIRKSFYLILHFIHCILVFTCKYF